MLTTESGRQISLQQEIDKLKRINESVAFLVLDAPWSVAAKLREIQMVAQSVLDDLERIEKDRL